MKTLLVNEYVRNNILYISHILQRKSDIKNISLKLWYMKTHQMMIKVTNKSSNDTINSKSQTKGIKSYKKISNHN